MGGRSQGQWSIVNDDVMGGISQGQAQAVDDVLLFRGQISLENNGGFSSVSFKPDPKMDMSASQVILSSTHYYIFYKIQSIYKDNFYNQVFLILRFFGENIQF